jgi:glucose/arabinose dehydrogenase
MTWYTGTMFPAEYQGALFHAQHGSWNRAVPVGARIMITLVKNGSVTQRPFAEGWLDKNGAYLGRPVDVQMLRDGSLLISDDFAGAIYRISYEGS